MSLRAVFSKQSPRTSGDGYISDCFVVKASDVPIGTRNDKLIFAIKPLMSRYLLLFLLLFFLTGCSPIIRPEQSVLDDEFTITNGESIGQTFVATYDGLMGVEVYLKPPPQASSTFHYFLQNSPGEETPLFGGVLNLDRDTDDNFILLPFTPQPASHLNDYYFYLEMNSPAQVITHVSAGNSYLNGSAYQNHIPLNDSQLVFNLVYHRGWLAWGLLKEFVSWSGWVIAAGFLFVLPGWGLLTAIWPGWDNDEKFTLAWAEKLALSVGISLAIYPILFAWAGWVGLPLGRIFTWLIPFSAVAILAWKYRSLGIQKQLQHLKAEFTSLQSILLIFALGLLIFTRFWVIRKLEMGLWGDSYHHTLITQLMVNHSGLFDSWEPYADLQSFTYHFGFHSGAALIHWVTGLAVPQAVLVFGQLVNIFAIWAIIPLANKITGLETKGTASWAGLGAVVLAGLMVNMPGFYVNWGRYTQLAGQAILPVSIWLLWEILDSQSVTRRQRWLVGLVLCGLALTHYRVVVFAAAFIAAYGLVRVWRGNIRPVVGHIIGVGLITGVLFLPWFFHLFAGKLVDFLSEVLRASPGETSQAVQQYNLIGDIQQYLPMSVWWAMLASFFWGILKRNGKIIIVGGWCLLILLIANPGWIGLPGAGAINNFSVLIAAYLPAGLLIGAGLAWIFEKMLRIRFSGVILATILISTALWGSRMRMSDVNPSFHALATRPDIRAGEWIQENLPPDSLILVNSFAAFGDTSVVGSDGGWWMPLLGERKTTLPPILYISETGLRPDYIAWVNELTFQIYEKGMEHPDVIASLTERGVTHVYVGQLQGRANYGGPVIEPGILRISPHFRQIYHQDRVWVFEFLP
jgi:hypothetical protein